MKWLRKKKDVPIGYHMMKVELAKRDMYISQLKEEIDYLKQRIIELEYRPEYYD